MLLHEVIMKDGYVPLNFPLNTGETFRLNLHSYCLQSDWFCLNSTGNTHRCHLNAQTRECIVYRCVVWLDVDVRLLCGLYFTLKCAC